MARQSLNGGGTSPHLRIRVPDDLLTRVETQAAGLKQSVSSYVRDRLAAAVPSGTSAQIAMVMDLAAALPHDRVDPLPRNPFIALGITRPRASSSSS